MADSFKPQLPKHLLEQQPATLDDLKFVFSQVEKRVKETADDGDRLHNKSLTIAGICLTIMTALIGWIVSNVWKEGMPLIGAASYVVGSLWYAISVLKPNVYPQEYRSIGSLPSDLLVDVIFKDQNRTEGDTCLRRKGSA
jgi:hypothetical protein